MLLTRAQLIVSVGAALVLAIPVVTFVSAMVLFPLLFFAALAITANLGLLVAGAMKALQAAGVRRSVPLALVQKWQMCSIMWLGCAFGLSHWGSAARSLGARDLPYFNVLFSPVLFAMGHNPF